MPRISLLSKYFIILSLVNPSFNKINYNKASPNYLYNENAIVGRWMALQENLAVEVYKQNDKFHAKIIWFKIEDQTRPMATRTDDKNPDPSLRKRKWLGMEVLRNLRYYPNDNDWEDGIIYDAKHGKEWDSVAWITNDGLLKVKGYWVFKFVSQTLTFKKM